MDRGGCGFVTDFHFCVEARDYAEPIDVVGRKI